MKNRCIITKTPNNITKFICLSENDSVVASNTTYEIILYSLHGDDSFSLKAFLVSECEIKDRLYHRLCYFLQYGEALITKNHKSCWIHTFDVEQQINEIKESLKLMK